MGHFPFQSQPGNAFFHTSQFLVSHFGAYLRRNLGHHPNRDWSAGGSQVSMSDYLPPLP
jgi:hypothetical protein